jgi:transposase
MDAPFAIDRVAREGNMDYAALHLLRRQKTPPLLDPIRQHILAMSQTVLPSSAAGKASSYTLTLGKRLTRLLDSPQLERSSNLAENSMRPVATGRKNRIHIGSPQAGPRVAAILSVVESCRRLKIPLRADIPPGLVNTPIPRAAKLTRAAWSTRKLYPSVARLHPTDAVKKSGSPV